jgi:hypothetical protein
MPAYNIVNAASMQAGQPEDIGPVLANFQAIQAIVNGGLDNTNIANGLLPSKLAGFPSNSQVVLKGDGSWGTLVIPYGISLPASPTDGQEAILVDSITNPSYQWRFRYNAGSASAYKWEFIGGAEASVEILTSEVRTAGSGYGDLATVGPSMTLPRAGEWIFAIETHISFIAVNATCYAQCAAQFGASAPDPNDAVTFEFSNGPTVSITNTLSRHIRRASAAQTVKLAYLAVGANGTFLRRRLGVLPVRVS